MATAPVYCTHKELKRVYPQIDSFDTKTPIYGWVHIAGDKYVSYDSGALDLRGAPPDAHFVVSANYGSAHAGGNRFANTEGNSIVALAGRSMNSKIDTTIEVIGLK